MFCPFALVWGVIQSLLKTPLVVGPVPETRGVTIDWLAPVYDQMCWVMGLGLAMRRRALALAELQRGERVLDVGCGTGVLTRLAAQAVGPEGTAVGIDPGPAMIGVARLKAARTRSRATFELGVIERLGFGDSTFDVVLSSFMLHHLPADVKRAGLGEVWRVLKPGAGWCWSTSTLPGRSRASCSQSSGSCRLMRGWCTRQATRCHCCARQASLMWRQQAAGSAPPRSGRHGSRWSRQRQFDQPTNGPVHRRRPAGR